MEPTPFVLRADPYSMPRLGALLPDERTLVDLQAAHFSMTEAPLPAFRDMDAYRQAGEHADELLRKVVAWAASQRPPGVFASLDAVRILDEKRP